MPDMLGTPGQDHNEARLERACPCGSSPARSTGSAADPYIRPAAAVESWRSAAPPTPSFRPANCLPPPSGRSQPGGRRPATHRERARSEGARRHAERRVCAGHLLDAGWWRGIRIYQIWVGPRVLSVGPGLDRIGPASDSGARKLAWRSRPRCRAGDAGQPLMARALSRCIGAVEDVLVTGQLARGRVLPERVKTPARWQRAAALAP